MSEGQENYKGNSGVKNCSARRTIDCKADLFASVIGRVGSSQTGSFDTQCQNNVQSSRYRNRTTHRIDAHVEITAANGKHWGNGPAPAPWKCYGQGTKLLRCDASKESS